MQKRKLIIGVVITILTTVFFTACSFEEPTLESFDGVELTESDKGDTIIVLNLTITNPNQQKMKLKSADFNISVNNIKVGSVTLVENQVIEGNGTYKVPLRMNLHLKQSTTELAISLGFAILTNNLQIDIDGDARGSMGFLKKTIPIHHTEKITQEDLKKLLM